MTIVLGTTFQAESRLIADAAGALARRVGESVRLVHVAGDPRAPVVLGTDEEHILGSIREDLEQEARRIESVSGATVRSHLAAGSPAEALASVAEWELATLLVIGASMEWPPRGLGRVAERVSRKSRVPVLTVRSPHALMAWLAGDRPLRILVGADLGRTAAAARAFAAWLGHAGACETEVLLVAEPAETHERLGLASPSDEHVLAMEAESVLMRELVRSAPPEETSAKLRVIPGRSSADVHLVAHADLASTDLIVVGQRRRSAIGRAWYGSVSRGVLRSAPTNVVTVPLPSGDATVAAGPPKIAVVGVDFTDTAAHALDRALALVGPGGEVHLAHVLAPAASSAETRSRTEEAWHQLARLPRDDRPAPRAAVERHVLEGDASEKLTALSRRVGADLIVLGARERPASGRAAVGAVTRGVLASSGLPVLVVPLGGV